MTTLPAGLEEVLLPYQRRFINDPRRFKIWVAARQIGKSTAVAYESVVLAVRRPQTAVLLVSASQRQSQELLERVKLWTTMLKAGVGDQIMIKESAQEVRLVNRSRIISLPANPDTIRGFSGHIFLDEFAFHRDSQRIWAAVFPIATRGFKLTVISTPNGRQNMFYRLWTEGGEHWGRQNTSIHEALSDGLSVDLDQLKRSTPDPQTWAQEYECRFVDEATAFLTYELIAAVESDEAGQPGRSTGGPAYIGADIGRRRDLTVYWVIEKVGDVFWTREVVVLSNAAFAIQDQELDRLVTGYRPYRLCLDQSGLGERVVEEAKDRYGRSRVEGVLFTAPTKQDLAMNLRRLCEDRLIRIPNDPAIRADLHSVRKVTTSSGNIRFEAERSDDGHADRFWALALAAHAAVEPIGQPVVTSSSSRGIQRHLKAY